MAGEAATFDVECWFDFCAKEQNEQLNTTTPIHSPVRKSHLPKAEL
jgi:hypothetical protein